MGFEQYARRKASTPNRVRVITDVALGVLLVLFLIVMIKPSAAEPLGVPLKLFVGVTALLLFVRATSWRSEQ